MRILLYLALMMVSVPLFAQEEEGEELMCAWVDVQELFGDYYKTKLARREINLERARIQKRSQEKLEVIRKRQEELMRLQAELTREDLKDSEREERSLQLPIVMSEIEVMSRERLMAVKAENTRLNDQMASRMKALLKEIVILTRERAKEAGYDLVVDSSGKNTSQVAPILYLNEATDITPMMKKELSKLAQAQAGKR